MRTKAELLALFPTVKDSVGFDYFMKKLLTGYELLGKALEKGGYATSDDQIILVLNHSAILDNVPYWKGINNTPEGIDLDLFLDSFRVETDFGFRISDSARITYFEALITKLSESLEKREKN